MSVRSVLIYSSMQAKDVHKPWRHVDRRRMDWLARTITLYVHVRCSNEGKILKKKKREKNPAVSE